MHSTPCEEYSNGLTLLPSQLESKCPNFRRLTCCYIGGMRKKCSFGGDSRVPDGFM